MNTFRLFLLLFVFIFVQKLSAQNIEIKGIVIGKKEPISFINVHLDPLHLNTLTDENGKFSFKNIQPGEYRLEVFWLGFLPADRNIIITSTDTTVEVLIDMKEDKLNLSEVVVSGSRKEVAISNSPVMISTIGVQTLNSVNSVTLSEGLNYTPGLRLETNCQNCGFTQVRMNGLDGSYSQILINNRPVFSSLMGVYGLEMLPANMIERIEVIRGGGSVMFGGNAIAGTINVITKDPILNSFEAGMNYSFINFQTPDRVVHFNGTVVSNDLKKGISIYGFNRDRGFWDANGDGFSEITKLKNTTVGFDAFWNIAKHSKIRMGAYFTNEFRRGGNKFDLQPHETDITEQLKHDIVGANVSYDFVSKNGKHRFSAFSSFQMVWRDSYYGGGGKVLGANDTITDDYLLALNAYGKSNDVTVVSGLQYGAQLHKKVELIAGAEYNFNSVNDQMNGYNRWMQQKVGTLGAYAQVEYKPLKNLTLLGGGRFDWLQIDGNYNFNGEQYQDKKQLPILVPRIVAMYEAFKNFKIRASFAQGYKGPQAFDEDLHIETVGGAAMFTRLDSNLVAEKSNSVNFSINYLFTKNKFQMSATAEGFYTHLNNPFITSDPFELPNGVAMKTKRNGDGAYVAGVNLEYNMWYSDWFNLQLGATIQMAKYTRNEVLWQPDSLSANNQDSIVFTQKMLRTPNWYGYFVATFYPVKGLSIAYTGTLTGSMLVAHIVDAQTEFTILKNTPVFFDNGIKIGYQLPLKKEINLELFAGMHNIFNSYQRDFDMGATRDANYIYGPNRPRTLYVGFKVGWNNK